MLFHEKYVQHIWNYNYLFFINKNFLKKLLVLALDDQVPLCFASGLVLWM